MQRSNVASNLLIRSYGRNTLESTNLCYLIVPGNTDETVLSHSSWNSEITLFRQCYLIVPGNIDETWSTFVGSLCVRWVIDDEASTRWFWLEAPRRRPHADVTSTSRRLHADLTATPCRRHVEIVFSAWHPSKARCRIDGLDAAGI